MSFGFSVGDFIAVGKLTVEIIDILRNSKSEYQELIRELESLGKALHHVDRLNGRGEQAFGIDQIKCAALTCRYTLEGFLAKARKYEKSLGLGRSSGKFKNAGRKFEWALGKKADANKLRDYLSIHIETINMLLMQQGLAILDIAAEQTEKNQEDLVNRLEHSSRELREVRGDVQAQISAVKENNSMIRELCRMVSGDIVAPFKALGEMVSRVCVSTQQIYTVVLEIRANIAGVDTRFTYFQAPIKVEDVLGRVFPFASECSIKALDAEINARFVEGPGKAEVRAGQYEIFNAKSSEQVLTVSENSVLLPGMSVSMAIILEKRYEDGGKCPIPKCPSTSFVKALGGGNHCSVCSIWFDGTSRKRKRDYEEGPISQSVIANADRSTQSRSSDLSMNSTRPGEKAKLRREAELYEETHLTAFKPIRLEIGMPGLTSAEFMSLTNDKRREVPYLDHQQLLQQMNGRNPRSVRTSLLPARGDLLAGLTDSAALASLSETLNPRAQEVIPSLTLSFARPDFKLFKYLWEEGVIRNKEYRELGNLLQQKQSNPQNDNIAVPPNTPRLRAGTDDTLVEGHLKNLSEFEEQRE